jgi:hypothetical protein
MTYRNSRVVRLVQMFRETGYELISEEIATRLAMSPDQVRSMHADRAEAEQPSI